MTEILWLITLVSKAERVIKGPPKTEKITVNAQSCDVRRNGALVFRGGNNMSIKVIIAPGQWLMVEKEQDKDKRE